MPSTTTQNAAILRGHDAAIDHERDDDLDRIRVARAVHHVIKTAPKGWSTRIGIYGAWGSGKTSVLNLLKELEAQNGSLVVSISAWSATSENELLASLYTAMRDETNRLELCPAVPIPGAFKNFVQRLGRALGEAEPVVQAAADTAVEGTGDLAGSAAKATASWINKFAAIKRQDIQAALDQLSPNGVHRIVVFIDDLDRSDPKILPHTLLALRDFLDWPDFSFVLAFDRPVVEAALGEYSAAYGERAHRFLEKIIDVGFELPEPTSHQMRRLALRCLGEHCDFVPLESREEVAIFLPRNPRLLKRITRSVAGFREVAQRHDPEDIDWTSILLQAALRQVAPNLADKVPGFNLARRMSAPAQRNGSTDPVAQFFEQNLGNPSQLSASTSEMRDLLEKLAASTDIIGRWTVREDTELRFDSAAFTTKEVNALVADISASSADQRFKSAIQRAREKSGLPADALTCGLMVSLFDAYRSQLIFAMRSELAQAHAAHALQAEKILSAIEFAWKNTDADLIQARQTYDVCKQAVNTAVRRIVHTGIVGTDLHKDRELALAEAVCESCSEPVRLYWFIQEEAEAELRPRPTAEAQHEMERLKAHLSRRARSRAASEILGLFEKPDGMHPHHSSFPQPQLIASCISKENSPLYTAPGMATLWSSWWEKSKANVHISLNAERWIIYLIGEAASRDQGTAQVMEIINSQTELVERLWVAAAAEPRQPDAQQRLDALRSNLVTHWQMSPEQLPLPQWWLRSEPASAL